MSTAATAAAPGRRALRIWRRNLLVWRKRIVPVLIHTMVDPLFHLFALGIGIGSLVGDIGGQSYLGFIAPAIVCINVMNVCSFEGTYLTYTRMHMQGTWDAMRNAPMTVDDIVLGEWAWACTKGMISSSCMLAALCIFGIVSPAAALAAVPLLMLFAASCGALALLYCSVSPSYEFFMYFFTLYMTPTLMLSGSFFPLETLPDWLEAVMTALPLALVVDSMRDILNGAWPQSLAFAVPQQALYAGLALYAAVRITRRRLA